MLIAVFLAAYFFVPTLLPLHPENKLHNFIFNLVEYTVPLFIVYAIAYLGVFRRAANSEIPKGSGFSTVLGVLCIIIIFLSIFGVGLVMLGREKPEYDRKEKKVRETVLKYTETAVPDGKSEKILLRMRQTGHLARVFVPTAFAIFTFLIALYIYTLYMMLHSQHFGTGWLFSSTDLLYFALLVGSVAMIAGSISAYYLRESYPYLVGKTGTVASRAFSTLTRGRAFVRINDRIFNAYLPEKAKKGERVRVSQIIYDKWSMTYRIYCVNCDDSESDQ